MAPISTSPEFSREEVGLALRNPGMPLEGLRYPITPIGMHYLLIHFDIPHLDPTTYRLGVKGLVENPLELSLEDIRSRPKVTMPVMMECGGNGRAHLSPRPVSAPVARRDGRMRRVDGHPATPDTRSSRPDGRRRRDTLLGPRA